MIVLRTLIAVVVESHVVLRSKPHTPIRQTINSSANHLGHPQPLCSIPPTSQFHPLLSNRPIAQVPHGVVKWVRSRCGGWAGRGIYFPHEAQEQLLPQLPVVVCVSYVLACHDYDLGHHSIWQRGCGSGVEHSDGGRGCGTYRKTSRSIHSHP